MDEIKEYFIETAPKWANWVARDFIGFWYFYETKPHLDGDMWFCSKRSKQIIGDGIDVKCHHSDTLINLVL